MRQNENRFSNVPSDVFENKWKVAGQAEPYLYDALREYAETDAYPFHMPGHKRRLASMTDPYRIDITEIDGFDNLHEAEGLLLQAQRRAARLYGAGESFFLVGGSTAGILAAIGACAHRNRGWKTGRESEAAYVRSGRRKEAGGDGHGGGEETGNGGLGRGKEVDGDEPVTGKAAGDDRLGREKKVGEILIARNCHKSVYHALYLNDLKPVYVYPQEGCFPAGIGGPIAPQDVEAALSQHPDVCAVVITSPTYDGVVSDIRRIVDAAHRYQIPLIVDAAHGAHFGMHPAFPPSAVSQGADLVVTSLHKTLPALTQTALLHVHAAFPDGRLLKRMLHVYQTSSPSYVLMASMDECIRRMRESGTELLEELYGMLERFYAITEDLKVLEILRTDDPSRILIGAGESGLSGKEICDILRHRYHLELEMSLPGYALALTSVGDDEEGLVRLSQALREIDMELDMLRLFPSHPRPEWMPEGKRASREASETEWPPAGEENSQDYFQDFPPHPMAGRSSEGNKDTRQEPERPECLLPPAQAWDAPSVRLPLKESEGMAAGEFVFLYPPGVPILVPGERVTGSLIAYCQELRRRGFAFSGCEDDTLNTIRVVES